MRRRLGTALLALYGRLAETGLTRRTRVRRAFERAYLLYKRAIEAGPIAQLQTVIEPGSIVLDAGANIGFFAIPFGTWVGPRGRVIAIEPESVNFGSLRRRVADAGLAEVVECVLAAAADRPGELLLELNPLHPGDHKLGSSGTTVAAVTVDGLVVGDERRVSLIKADVQGAEPMVLAGAREVIARDRPAVFLELDKKALRRLGSSPAELVASMTKLGYRPHRLAHSGIVAIEPDALIAASADSHLDALFLPAVGASSIKESSRVGRR